MLKSTKFRRHVIHEVLVLLKRTGLAAWADIEISQTNLDAWPEEGDILTMDLDIHVTEVDDDENELEEEEEEEQQQKQQGGGGEGGLTNSRETIDPTLTAYNTSCGEMRSEARDAFFVEGGLHQQPSTNTYFFGNSKQLPPIGK